MFLKSTNNPHNQNHTGRQIGFSLVELLIVVVIMGILSGYVTYNLTSDEAELKSFIFNTKAQFQRAKFEAIKRSRNVIIDFDFDPPAGLDNGYTIWVDDVDDGGAYNAAVDTVIETVVFQDTRIYNNNPPIGAEPAGPGGSNIGDGVSAGADNITMKPDGGSENGTVYIYLPRNPPADISIASGPWAIITSTVGRIRVDEWNGSEWVVD